MRWSATATCSYGRGHMIMKRDVRNHRGHDDSDTSSCTGFSLTFRSIAFLLVVAICVDGFLHPVESLTPVKVPGVQCRTCHAKQPLLRPSSQSSLFRVALGNVRHHASWSRRSSATLSPATPSSLNLSRVGTRNEADSLSNGNGTPSPIDRLSLFFLKLRSRLRRWLGRIRERLRRGDRQQGDDGQFLPQPINEVDMTEMEGPSVNAVYVLECEQDRFYIGSTVQLEQRLRQHFGMAIGNQGGPKSAWTSKHPPLRLHKLYKNVPKPYVLGLEAQVTAEYMWRYGVNNCRGAQFSQVRTLTRAAADVEALVGFLGHYNDLNYQEVRERLRWILPAPVKEEANAVVRDSVSMEAYTNNQKFRNAKSSASFLANAPEKRRCFKCGQFGHLASDCNVKGQQSKSARACFRCGKRGHIAANCPEKDFRTCFKCGKIGHIASDCPEK